MRAERWLRAPEATPGTPGTPETLQSGFFCASCEAHANTWYWRCDECNDGEWGFCGPCVNQGRHCTHPLLPIGLDTSKTPTPTTPHSRHILGNARDANSLPGTLIAIPVHTSCDLCKLPIPPSSTRYHCPTCNDGDYDICAPCYRSQAASGRRIARNDGPRGWRRCVEGHRMLVVGFESRAEGQWRVVAEGVVGGWRMPEEEAVGDGDKAAGERFPPSGGHGMRMMALWTRLPDEGVEDELVFPRRAVVSEVIDINENWCWGVYCRKGGMFPGAYCRVV